MITKDKSQNFRKEGSLGKKQRRKGKLKKKLKLYRLKEITLPIC